MAERIVSLSVATLFDDDHNHPDIPRFIAEFSAALYSGDGKKPQMLDRLDIGADFPVRLLVGIPQTAFTREKRLVAEAYCSMVFGRPLGDDRKLWSHGKGWRPQNPGRVPAPIRESKLDIDWMLALGPGKATWCNDILLAPTAFDGKGRILESTVLRYYFALAAYGFFDPHQFFNADH